MRDIFRLTKDWENLKEGDELIIYGVGRIGRRVLPTLIKEFKIPFLIDKRKSDDKVFGLAVVDLQEAVDRLKQKKAKIVITTVRAAYEDIARELIEKGFKEYEDFCIFERFAGEWNLRWRNRCVLSKIDTVITSRCTLKCTNCNMFIGHASTSEDMSLESLKRNFDTFFDSVDFVYEYTLLGGEPFLHKELSEIISYLGTKYGERIGKINLISNGTVLPNEKILDTLTKYKVSVHISDYTVSLNYGDKLAKVVDSLSNAGIEYYVIPNNVWKDVVYPRLDYSTDAPRKHMITCGHSTHSVDNGRLYWCDPAFAAECFTGFPAKEDDSLDLVKNKREHSKYEASVNILRYLLGDVNERGYMTICEKCAGVGEDNPRIIKAGVQF